MAFARHQFELSQPQEDGSPLSAHLEAHEARSGKPHPMLVDPPSLPGGSERLWRDFLELHGSRGSTGFGAARITFVDIHAWQHIRGTVLQSWEADLIRKTDDMWMADFMPKPKAA